MSNYVEEMSYLGAAAAPNTQYFFFDPYMKLERRYLQAFQSHLMIGEESWTDGLAMLYVRARYSLEKQSASDPLVALRISNLMIAFPHEQLDWLSDLASHSRWDAVCSRKSFERFDLESEAISHQKSVESSPCEI